MLTQRLSLKILLLGLLILVISSNMFAQDAYQVRMAMIGNSITQGSQLANPATECYPAQLDTMLSRIYGDTVLIRNYGVSGRTMLRKASHPIWNESKFRAALEFVPDICLIFLGTNDSQPVRWDQWGDEFLDDYLAMIDTFKFRNPDTRFIVCYPPPIWEGHPYGTDYWDSHNDSVVVNHIMPIIDTVVQQTGATLVDFHAPFVDSLQFFPDKLHPNAQGAEIMARMLFDTLVNKNMVHEVDAGKAFVTLFRQSPLIIPDGDNVTMIWKTIFADSVLLDGVPVAGPNGNQQVVAQAGKLYFLTAKNAKNTSTYPLLLNTSPRSSLDPAQNELNVAIYPNPTKEILYLEVKNMPSTQLDIRVFNSLGQAILQKQIRIANPEQATIDLNTGSLQQGVYYYSVEAEGKWTVGKFVKGEK